MKIENFENYFRYFWKNRDFGFCLKDFKIYCLYILNAYILINYTGTGICFTNIIISLEIDFKIYRRLKIIHFRMTTKWDFG